jgi:N-carbamoylputrescine amidase
MTSVIVAAAQFACTWHRAANIAKAKTMVREAAARGARIVVLPELFETPYFCQDQSAEHFALACPFEGNPLIVEFADLAKELSLVLPLSFFERAQNAYFNALALIDADGRVIGRYRKSHIPDGPGYQEKYYFHPGDTGFRVWPTRYGNLGCAICWDQWFPETARILALKGADILIYPTAIGSEPPPAPPVDSRDHWRRVMQGHAAANYLPVLAANRIGAEQGQTGELRFYGSSFIAGPTGEIVAELGRGEEGVITAAFDFAAIAKARASWGLFRDRRPDLYGPLLSADGGTDVSPRVLQEAPGEPHEPPED